MDAILVEIRDEIKAKKKQLKASSRANSYGVMSEVIKRHKKANPWLNRDVLNNYKSRKIVIRIDADGSSISSLTGTDYETDKEPMVNEEAEEESIIVEDESTEETTGVEEVSDPGTGTSDVEQTTIEENQGGRPKGTTNEKIREMKRNQKLAMNYAASKAALLMESFSNQGYDRLPKGTYKEVILEAESKFSLSGGSLNMKTLLTRVKRKIDMQQQRSHLTYDCIGGPLFRCTDATCSHGITCYHKASTPTYQLNGDNR
jgi:hypothetical protein